MRRTAIALLAILGAALGLDGGALAARQSWLLTIEAPPALEGTARRLTEIDADGLERVLNRAGLDLPDALHVSLVAEDDVRARSTPAWVVGQALDSGEVRIFPERVSVYPYDSIESVFRHEVVHVALAARADGWPLPRWFHEGVAVSVERGWGLTDNVRLLFAARRGPAVSALTGLFRSGGRSESAEAYRLATALVEDLRRRHGAALPGAVAARVGLGESFTAAFTAEAGEPPEAAAARAWATYRAAAAWVPVLTGGTTLWTAILGLAAISFVARLRRRAAKRREWAEEEERRMEPGGTP